MKKLLLLAALLTGLHSFAQWNWEKIEGNGNLKKETREVGSFTGVASAGSWNVQIAYGKTGSIQVEGDENLLDYIETKVSGGKLIIESKKVSLRTKNRITIYVSATRLHEIALSGSGDIAGEGRFSNDGTTDIKVSGSGNIRLSFNQFSHINASVSGSGNIVLNGMAETVNARISGSGDIDCDGVTCDAANAKISGSGNIKVNAGKSVDISIAGSGNVYYKGAATEVHTRRAGSGRAVRG